MEDNRSNYKTLIIEKRSWKPVLSSILKAVLSFLLSVAFLFLAVLITIQCNCFNSKTICRVLASGGFYDKVLQELRSDASMITKPTGLSIEVLDGVFLKEEVQHDVNNNILALFHQRVIQTDVDVLRNRLRDQVDYLLDRENIQPDRVQEQNKEQYIEAVANLYCRTIKIPLLEFLIRLTKDYTEVYFISMGICCGVILLIMIMLCMLSELPSHFFFSVYNSTMAAALMLVVVPLLLLADKTYTKLRVTPESAHEFATDYITWNLYTLICISAIFGFISIGFLVMERKMKGKAWLRFYNRTRMKFWRGRRNEEQE